MEPREVIVPLELTPEDVDCGVVLKLDIRVTDSASNREAA